MNNLNRGISKKMIMPIKFTLLLFGSFFLLFIASTMIVLSTKHAFLNEDVTTLKIYIFL